MRWPARVALKWSIFATVTLVALFPNPLQLWRHLSRVCNLDAMVEPFAPELVEFESSFVAWMDGEDSRARGKDQAQTGPWRERLGPRDVQKQVEKFVYRRVDYAWDWELWGSADYMPTVAEMYAQAAANDGRLREDCDGRAVMAASLMRRLGYDSKLVTDLRHVWVETSEGRWMNPGRAATIKSAPEGSQTSILATLTNVPVALSYGTKVFPIWREIVILLTAWALMRRPGLSWPAFLVGGALLFAGLFFMRRGYLAPEGVSTEVKSWPAWVGIVFVSSGLGWLAWASDRANRKQRARAISTRASTALAGAK